MCCNLSVELIFPKAEVNVGQISFQKYGGRENQNCANMDASGALWDFDISPLPLLSGDHVISLKTAQHSTLNKVCLLFHILSSGCAWTSLLHKVLGQFKDPQSKLGSYVASVLS